MAAANALNSTLQSIAILMLVIAIGVAVYIEIRENGRVQAELQQQIQTQAPALEEARKVKNQLETLAGKTALLAEQGNENAERLVAQLRQQGINFHPPK